MLALLFSATFRKKVERLCRDILTDPVRIVIGDVGEANTDITQLVTVFHEPKDKWAWLLGRLVEFISGISHNLSCDLVFDHVISWQCVNICDT